MAVLNFIILGTYSLICLYTFASGHIIRSYFTKCKPLGMQTFLDKMIYHFTIVNNVSVTYVLILMGFSEPFGPSGAPIAITMAYTFQFLSLVFVFSIFSVLAVR